MSDDLAPNDVVVCIDGSPCRDYPYPGAPFGVPEGSMHRVRDVWLDNDDVSLVISLSGIESEGMDDDIHWEGYDATRFRKLPPAEPEFISLIRSLGVPKKVREDA